MWGPSCRVLASCAQGRGFNPWPIHTKDFKNGANGKIEGKWQKPRKVVPSPIFG